MPHADPERRKEFQKEYHRDYNERPDRKAYRQAWYLANKDRVKDSVVARRRATRSDDTEAALRRLEELNDLHDRPE